MISDTAKLVIARALAFTSTLVFSLVLVGGLPGVREQRQRYFARAAMDGNLRRMQLLHFAGANINSRDDCCAPLFLAAGEGRVDVVRYLLEEGADVNARERLGDTALIEATYYGHIGVIKELLLRGAEINAIGVEGTALDIALHKNNASIADLLRHYGGKKACEIRNCS